MNCSLHSLLALTLSCAWGCMPNGSSAALPLSAEGASSHSRVLPVEPERVAASDAKAVTPSPTQTDVSATHSAVSPLDWHVSRVDSRAISHLAAGRRRVAALATEHGATRLLVFELEVSSELSGKLNPRVDVMLPSGLHALPADNLALFMGRDDWPRLIVSTPVAKDVATYHRYRPAQGWQSPRDEQGALASNGRVKGYYGVLGHLDPEVLCVPDFACYEKRIQGWKRLKPPGTGVWNVVLTRPTAPDTPEAWAWSRPLGGSLLRLGSEWQHALPPVPDAPPIALLDWAEGIVAVTTRAIVLATPQPAAATRHTPSDGGPTPLSSTAPSVWSVIASVDGATAALVGPHDWLMIGTSSGVFVLEGREATPRPVTFNGLEEAACGRVSALDATLGLAPLYLVACERGLFQLNDATPQSNSTE